jgi:NitT/TauT family transport system permease protein
VRAIVSRLTMGIVLVAAWQLASTRGWIDPALLPPFSKVLAVLWHSVGEGELHRHVAATLGLMGMGFAVSLLVGVPVGVAMGLNRDLDEALSVYVDFLRALPAAALIPLFMLFFVGQPARVLVVGCSGALVIALACRSGVRRTEPARDEYLSLLGVSRLERFTKLLLWEMLGEFLVGVRIAVSLTFIVATVLEMLLGARYGLGDLLLNSQASDKATMYAVILVLGTIGYFLNWLLRLVERLLARLGLVSG